MGKGKVRADEVPCPQAASPSLLLPPTWAGGCVLPNPCGQPRGALLSVLSAGLAVLRGMDSLQRLKSSVAAASCWNALLGAHAGDRAEQRLCPLFPSGGTQM